MLRRDGATGTTLAGGDATPPGGDEPPKTAATAASVAATESSSATTARSTRATAGRSAATGDVVIGVRYATGGGAVIGSLGIQGVSTGDQEGFAQAMVDHINATGGAAGHQLRIVWSPLRASDALANSAGADQETCSQWTEDNHMFAAVSPMYSTATLQKCLAQRHVPFIEDNYNYWNGDDKAITPSYFVPAYPDQPRLMTFYVQSLLDDGWFGPHPKIGVGRSSNESRDRADAGLRKALAAHGLAVADTVSYTTPEQVAAGVLKFKAEDINRVFVIDGSGGIEAMLWMTDAEQQKFRPLYAVNSQTGPVLLANNVPAAQLHGARGVGWLPTVDVDAPALSAADMECLDLMHRAGKETPDQTAMRFALATCDVFRFFVEAYTRGHGTTAAALISGAESIGTAFVPTGSFAARIGPGRHDGTAQARKLAFDDGCRCFRYVSAPFDVG